MMYGYGYGMGGWMIIGWIITAAVVVFAIYGLIVVVKRSEAPASKKYAEPLNILKERLARGEITTEEYNKIKDELLK